MAINVDQNKGPGQDKVKKVPEEAEALTIPSNPELPDRVGGWAGWPTPINSKLLQLDRAQRVTYQPTNQPTKDTSTGTMAGQRLDKTKATPLGSNPELPDRVGGWAGWPAPINSKLLQLDSPNSCIPTNQPTKDTSTGTMAGQGLDKTRNPTWPRMNTTIE